MKKIFSFLAAAVVALGFYSCEDVPAPYEINDGTEDVPEVSDALIDESFASTLGQFSAVNVKGDYSWKVDYSCAQVTSYTDDDGDGQKENNEAESWLVSKQLDLKEVDAAYLNFEYILRYVTTSQMKTHYRLLVSKNYTGNVAEADWTQLDFNLVQGSDWETWYNSGDVALPAEFCNVEGVVVALCYTATTKAATWEVRNFKMMKGEVPAGPSEPGEEDGPKKLPYTETFSTDMGGFKSYTTAGQGEWIIDYSTAKATGYDNATKVTTAGTYYLVSPEISLEGQTEAHVLYEYIVNYNKGDENQQFLITAAFNEAQPAEGWTLLNQTHAADKKNAEGKADWNTFTTADLDIPVEFMGKTIRLAFRYNTNATSGSTWEVRNFAIQAGKAGTGGGSDQPEGPVTSDGLVENGDFESWSGNVPTSWKTASSAGNATLAQSTDARSGSYAVLVKGTSSGNKRLGYKETTYKAGTYTMTFYAKAATATGGSVRPGYATFNADGTINGSGYKYGEYTNNLSQSEWTKVEHSFTLASDQQICLVIMNSKNPGADVLIDDFSLSTADGGLVGGGDAPAEPDEEEPVQPVGNFKLTTTVADGSYLLGALVNGTYKLATHDASKSYGYVNVIDAKASGDVISTATANEVYTIKSVSGGYTIQAADGRYLYMKGDYNSFNFDASMPSEGAVWTITPAANGTVNIVNVLTGKTWQYSIDYTSYGAYPEVATDGTKVLPSLFVKQ